MTGCEDVCFLKRVLVWLVFITVIPQDFMSRRDRFAGIQGVLKHLWTRTWQEAVPSKSRNPPFLSDLHTIASIHAVSPTQHSRHTLLSTGNPGSEKL